VGSGEVNLLIGIEYPTCAFEQFNRIHIEDLKNIMRKLTNKAGTEEGITIEIMKLGS